MTIKNTVLTTFVAIAAGVVPAFASDPIPKSSDNFEVFGTVDDWTVYADTDSGSCLVERADAEGNAIQMGLTKDHTHAYLGVFTLADIDIKNKQKIEIVVDDVVYEGESRGIKSKKLEGGYSGGYIVFDSPVVATAIAEGQTLIAFPKKTGAFTVDLTGTKKAMEEGRKCNLSLVSQ